MINLLCKPSLFKIVLWVAMETLRFDIVQSDVFFWTNFLILLFPVNNLVFMEICPGGRVQSRSN